MTTNNSVNDIYLQKSNNLSDVNSKSTSFNNIDPMTTLGDIIYASATATGGTATRLPIGSTGNVLTLASGIPSWGSGGGGGSGSVVFPAISGNWYVCGTIDYGLNSISSSTSITTGTLYFMPFFVTSSITYKAIGLGIISKAAGTTVMGIYNDNGSFAPTGSPITNSNSTSISNVTTTASTYTFISTITLNAGIYWLAFSVSATNDVASKINGNEIGGTGMGSTSIPVNGAVVGTVQYGWTQSFSYSATLPSVGSLSAMSLNVSPYVYLQAN